MTALEHLISPKCPACNLSLMRGATPIAADTVFCTQCGRAGLYEEVIKNGEPLATGALTRAQIDDLLREFGIPDK